MRNPFVGSVQRNGRSLFGDIIVIIALLIMAALMLYPLFMLVNVSFKPLMTFLREPMSLDRINLFDSETWQNYQTAWVRLEVFRRFWITVIMTLSAATLTSVVSALAAFPISRGHFKHANKVYIFFLMSMFFPGSLIATIFFMQLFRLYDNPIGVVLLWALGGLAINIFIMVGFIKGVPRELDDAAIMDGCPYFKYIFLIAAPLMKPIIATVFMLRAIGSWNDFITPYLFLTSQRFRTLSTGLFLFKGQYANNWPVLAAAIIIVAAPMVILYIFMQRYVIEGMTAGALKG